MVQRDKLIQRLKSKPTDFTFDELETLLGFLGYHRSDKGHTSGSRIVFTSDLHGRIMLHRPHPSNVLKRYQIKLLLQLEREELI